MAQQKALMVAKKPPEKAVQVMVRLTIIRKRNDIRRYLSSPVDVGRDGRVTRLRIAVPVPRGPKGSYLVLDVPPAILQKLIGNAGRLGRVQGESFIAEWVKKSGEDMMKQYLGKRRPRSFRLTLSPIITPKFEPRAIPKKVERRAPAMPPTMLSRPKEIRKGHGTKSAPFHIYPMEGRETKGDGGKTLKAPLEFSVEGTKVYFTIHATWSQLRGDRRTATISELNRIIRQAFTFYTTWRGVTIREKFAVGVGPKIESIIRRAMAQSKEFRDYIYGNR